MAKMKEKAVSADALDLKSVSEKLEALPHSQRMYVAGAIIALEALNKTSPSTGKESA